MADDPELAAIRAARLQQLQQQGAGVGGGGGGGAGGQDAAAAQAAEESKRQDLARILEPAARERLSRISLVRPEHAERVKDMLLRMARAGQIRQRVSEEQLVGLLDQVANATSSAGSGKITFTRKSRPQVDDEDSDFDI